MNIPRMWYKLVARLGQWIEFKIRWHRPYQQLYINIRIGKDAVPF